MLISDSELLNFNFPKLPTLQIFFLGSDIFFETGKIITKSHPYGDLLCYLFNNITNSQSVTKIAVPNSTIFAYYDNSSNAILFDGPYIGGTNVYLIIEYAIKFVQTWLKDNKINNNLFRVNLLGFSRGGVAALVCLHKLVEIYQNKITVNPFIIDPVPGHVWYGWSYQYWDGYTQYFDRALPNNIECGSIFLMLNERTKFFTPIIPELIDSDHKINIIPLYGNHSNGSGNLFDQNTFGNDSILDAGDYQHVTDIHKVILIYIAFYLSKMDIKIAKLFLQNEIQAIVTPNDFYKKLLALFDQIEINKEKFAVFNQTVYYGLGTQGVDRFIYYAKARYYSDQMKISKIPHCDVIGFVNTLHEKIFITELLTNFNLLGQSQKILLAKDDLGIEEVVDFLQQLFINLADRSSEPEFIAILQAKQSCVNKILDKFVKILIDIYLQNNINNNYFAIIEKKLQNIFAHVVLLKNINIIDHQSFLKKINNFFNSKIQNVLLQTQELFRKSELINAPDLVSNLLNCAKFLKKLLKLDILFIDLFVYGLLESHNSVYNINDAKITVILADIQNFFINNLNLITELQASGDNKNLIENLGKLFNKKFVKHYDNTVNYNKLLILLNINNSFDIAAEYFNYWSFVKKNNK